MKGKILTIASLVFAIMYISSFACADPIEAVYIMEITGTSFLPATIYAGDSVSVAVNVKNNATSLLVNDVNGILDIGNQFEPIDLNYSIDRIEAGSTKTLIFKFIVKQDTLPGYYPAFITINYPRNERQVTETQTLTIPVSKASKYFDIAVSPKVMNPGKQTDLVFSVKNLTGIAISNISFSWAESSSLILPLGSDNKRYLDILQAGQQQDFSYLAAADPAITPGIYPLDITLSFSDVNGLRTQTSQIGIIVGGGTDFEVGAELSGTQLSLSIANIGSNNADAVVVRIPNQPGVSVHGSNIAILGNLNQGDYTLANFQVSFSTSDFNARPNLRSSASAISGQPPQMPSGQIPSDSSDRNFGSGAFGGSAQRSGANKITVEINYTDTTGERQVVTRTINLSSSSASLGSSTGLRNTARAGGSNNNLLPIGLFVLLAAGAIIFNKRHAKKSWKHLAAMLFVSAAFFSATIVFFSSDIVACLAVAALSGILLYWFFTRFSEVKASK